MRVDLSKPERLTFLIDTGAEISIVRSACLRPVFSYEPTKGIDVKGISDVLLRTGNCVDEIVYYYARNYSHVSRYRR